MKIYFIFGVILNLVAGVFAQKFGQAGDKISLYVALYLYEIDALLWCLFLRSGGKVEKYGPLWSIIGIIVPVLISMLFFNGSLTLKEICGIGFAIVATYLLF